jgi:hypothetical protein
MSRLQRPLSRFVEIWNSVPGNLEVKKFSDRKKGSEIPAGASRDIR